ncbi:6-phosphogluconolactonase [Millisia brevis]|uniref:6-phosphogluconolactonase n=1 Tax=Millisia brevis TaxID=264148 RepID=UPI00083312DF|nr:6-phosphogluconolactonase [Millisia brevis]
MTDARTEVVVLPDAAGVAEAAGARLVEAIIAAQGARGTASVVLTGGGTGIATLAAVRHIDAGTDPGIDWSNVDIWFGDERFVPDGDPERNVDQAREALLDHVEISEESIHAIAASDDPAVDGDPAVAAAAYAAELGDNPTFDVHLLGMGGEGHINSLFPHTPAVRETEQLVVAVTDSPKPPPVRVTLTLPAVHRARQVWLLVAGSEKAEAVAEAIGGADPDDWPSAGAHGTEATVWFVDEKAAANLD